jgi:RNA polymerase sigma factor (sigma-70 family)
MFMTDMSPVGVQVHNPEDRTTLRPDGPVMSDGEIAASIARSELAGLAAAFDRYAVSLYGYCQSLLIYPADAADAVHDTFVIAWTKIPCLQDPERLRTWLFAVARNECYMRPRAGALSAPRTDTAEMTGRAADAGDAELQFLTGAALTGLAPAERELIELNLRYWLEGADLADIVGLPRSQAHALATRARSRFTKLLGLLLAAWPARGRCPGAAGLLDSWHGTLTAALCKRLTRHIRRCSVCGRIRHHEISPATMLALLPAARPPYRLWERLAALVTDDSPDAVDHRQRIARRAEPLTRTGFPVQATRPPAPRVRGRYVLPAAAAVAAVALLGGGAFLVDDNSSPSGPSPVAGAQVPTGSSGSARALTVVPPISSSRAHSSAAQLTPAVSGGLSPAAVTSLPPATLAPTSKASTSPAPTKTAPTSPAPTKTAPTSPAPTKTAPTSPAPTSPAPTSPVPTSPAPTSPVLTSPVPTSPAPASPATGG